MLSVFDTSTISIFFFAYLKGMRVDRVWYFISFSSFQKYGREETNSFSLGRRKEEEIIVPVISSNPFQIMESGKETKEEGDVTTVSDPLSLSYSTKERGLEISDIRASISLYGTSSLSSSEKYERMILSSL